ncbi:MAG: AfsR/SARP family transcriptional regulator [Frankiaceae bacterium]
MTRLVEAAWDHEPPPTASHQVRKAVADLRRRIPGGNAVLLTDGPGYRAAIDDAQLDLGQFGQHMRDAERADSEGQLTEATAMLTRALTLWRGPLLSGLGGQVIESAAVTLEEHRLRVAEWLFDVRLRLGEAAELVPGLRQLVAEHPLRETPRARLMVALSRSGRQAEALDEYVRTRALLVEELGIEPGPALSQVYQGILQQSPDLTAPAGSVGPSPARPGPAGPPTPPPPPLWIPPSTLPMDLADFTGRAHELVEVLAAATDGGSTRIVAIDGMGGSGKTALAVRAAHRLVPAYPDGQLYLDLRGYAPEGQPVTTAGALDSLLRAMYVPRQQVPEELTEQLLLWQTMLADKRVLLLLDNVADASTIRPLLPTSPGCAALVTSRARLLDLDGARWMSIGALSAADSADLITTVLGADRVEAESDAARELAELCGHLPLALRIAATRLRNRPRWAIWYLVDRLRDEAHRLLELSSGDRDVATTLRLSYEALSDDCRRALRLLSVHSGEIGLHAAAAILGLDVRATEDVLEELLDVRLLEQPAMGRYAFHDLVRSFAAGLTAGPAGDEGALERLLEHQLLASELACDVLFPARARRSTGSRGTRVQLPELADPSAAEAWLVREQRALQWSVVAAHRRGLDRQAACLARNVGFWLNAVGQVSEFAEISRLAVAAARRTGDATLLGTSLSHLGVACWKLGRFDESMDVARQAHEIAVRQGDQHTEAHSNGVLGLYNSYWADSRRRSGTCAPRSSWPGRSVARAPRPRA